MEVPAIFQSHSRCQAQSVEEWPELQHWRRTAHDEHWAARSLRHGLDSWDWHLLSSKIRRRFGDTTAADRFGSPVFRRSSFFACDSLPRSKSQFFLAACEHQAVQEVHSASTELLTSASLKELKQVIQAAYVEHEDISGQLEAARQDKERASRRFLSWENGFLFKKLFKTKFVKRKTEAETATAKVAELEEQLRLTTIAT